MMSHEDRQFAVVKGGKGARIALDGPALRIEHPKRAPVRILLSRVSVLAIEEPCAIDGGVVEATARAGVVIRWVASDGQGAGDLIPHRVPRRYVADSLDLLLRRTDWREAYASWRRGDRLLHILRLLDRRAGAVYLRSKLDPLAIEGRILGCRPQRHAAFQSMIPWLRADARGLLQAHGWPIVRILEAHPGPDVPADILTVLRWECAHRLHRTPLAPSQTALDWYAAHRQAIVSQGRCTLDGFERWLADRVSGLVR